MRVTSVHVPLDCPPGPGPLSGASLGGPIMGHIGWGGPSTGPTLLFIVVVSPCRCEPLRAGCCGGGGGVRCRRGKLIIIRRQLACLVSPCTEVTCHPDGVRFCLAPRTRPSSVSLCRQSVCLCCARAPHSFSEILRSPLPNKKMYLAVYSIYNIYLYLLVGLIMD